MSHPALSDGEAPHWYALRVYRSLVAPIVALCERDGVTCYRPMRLAGRLTAGGMACVEEALVPNLLFVRSRAGYIEQLRLRSRNRGMAYCYPGTREPAPIDDGAMERFMQVVQAGAPALRTVELPIDKGDRVRVTEGIFQGAEGYIRRVDGTRRLVVAIEGVVAVAVTHIPRQFLMRISG